MSDQDEKMETMLDNVMGMIGDEHLRDDVLREETDDWIVDTVYAPDFSKWETAVQQLGPNEDEWTNMVIVEQYPDLEAAKVGHARWVESMKAEPRQKLKDLNLYGVLEDE